MNVLILGSTKWHLPIFSRARELGLGILAVDPDPGVPGAALADAFATLDVRDFDGILAFASPLKVGAVVTGVDLAVPCAARLAARLGLPGIAAEAALRSTDKLEMRLHARRLGLEVPEFHAFRDEAEAARRAQEIGYPCILKPCDSFGSRGVSVVESPAGLGAAARAALASSFSGRGVIEELMQGTEGSAEGFVDSHGTFHVLGISKKRKSPLPYRYDLELHYPGEYSEPQFDAITRYVSALVQGFGISQGLTHTEFVIDGDRVRLIETAARGCGGYVIGKLIPAITGVDTMGLLLKQALGEKVSVPPMKQEYGVLRFLLVKSGRVVSVRGVEEACRLPGVIDAGVDLKVGDEARPVTSTAGRAGYVLTRGPSPRAAEAAASAAERLVRIETNGMP